MTGGDDLADAVRHALEGLGSGKIHEVRMFGGIGFMLNGNLLVAASDRGLLVRVGKDRHGEALERPGARAMVMLRSPHLSMTEIALRVGYSNASSFERAFQRWTGHSPAEFRRTEAKMRVS